MAKRITDKEIGEIFQIWSSTSLGRAIQEDGIFNSSTEWWAALKDNSQAYLSKFGLIEIIPEGKRLAKVILSPFESGDDLYNALLDDAIQTAWSVGFTEVLGSMLTKKWELRLFSAPIQQESQPETIETLDPVIADKAIAEPALNEDIGVTLTEEHKDNGSIQSNQGMDKSNDKPRNSNKRKRKDNKQPVTV